MLPNLDVSFALAAAVAASMLAYRSGRRQVVNRAQLRLFRRSFVAGSLASLLVLFIAWGSASGLVPLWLAGLAVFSWCVVLPLALAWFRRELQLRAREPYADGFS